MYGFNIVTPCFLAGGFTKPKGIIEEAGHKKRSNALAVEKMNTMIISQIL
jgi:hypothetical protein